MRVMHSPCARASDLTRSEGAADGARRLHLLGRRRRSGAPDSWLEPLLSFARLVLNSRAAIACPPPATRRRLRRRPVRTPRRRAFGVRTRGGHGRYRAARLTLPPAPTARLLSGQRAGAGGWHRGGPSHNASMWTTTQLRWYLRGTPARRTARFPNDETPVVAGVSVHSGGGIRTRDLRVMSPTSYLAAPPRDADATRLRGSGAPGSPPASVAQPGRVARARSPPSRC